MLGGPTAITDRSDHTGTLLSGCGHPGRARLSAGLSGSYELLHVSDIGGATPVAGDTAPGPAVEVSWVLREAAWPSWLCRRMTMETLT